MISKLDKLDTNNIQSYVMRLAHEKGFLEAVFNTIREGVIVIDSHLRLQYANKAACDMLGFPRNFHDLRINRFLRDIDWKRILREDEGEWYRISSRDVEVFYPKRRVLSFYLVPHESRKGMATVILTDITEKRRSEQENFESQKLELVSTLAAGVAHEIGNPLNSLNIHLQLLERHLKGTPDREATELLAVAKSEVERLDLIINQFLRAIRPAKPQLLPLDIKQVVDETLGFLREEIEARAISIRCDWPEALPNIHGDAGQLKQALYNLVKNAMQAMPDGGELGVSCSVDETYLALAISDTGKGIDPADMNEIFNPYFTTKERGTGLGLMVVERIVREHGAELDVESSQGKGTVFTLKFPLKSVKMRLLGPSQSEPSP